MLCSQFDCSSHSILQGALWRQRRLSMQCRPKTYMEISQRINSSPICHCSFSSEIVFEPSSETAGFYDKTLEGHKTPSSANIPDQLSARHKARHPKRSEIQRPACWNWLCTHRCGRGCSFGRRGGGKEETDEEKWRESRRSPACCCIKPFFTRVMFLFRASGCLSQEVIRSFWARPGLRIGPWSDARRDLITLWCTSKHSDVVLPVKKEHGHSVLHMWWIYHGIFWSTIQISWYCCSRPESFLFPFDVVVLPLNTIWSTVLCLLNSLLQFLSLFSLLCFHIARRQAFTVHAMGGSVSGPHNLSPLCSFNHSFP